MKFIEYDPKFIGRSFLWCYVFLFWRRVSIGIFRYRIYLNATLPHYFYGIKKWGTMHKHIGTIRIGYSGRTSSIE